MLATVAALANGRCLFRPLRREDAEVRKKLAVLVAMAMMVAMMVASTGTASAVALSNGQGGFKANATASFGIGTAVVNTQKNDCGGLCE